MFSGKSEELIRRVKRAVIARRSVQVFKPAIDDRFGSELDKLEAICVVCGESATRTQRIVNGVPADYDDPIIVIGAQEAYEARCRTCHTVPRRATAPA